MIPTKKIDGDVAVGRNVAAGGNATVRGNVTVEHNVRVKGWLDAPNIKGPAKGLFADEASLNAAYPLPEKGWWALVGDSLPAAVYTAKDGEWTASGKTAGTLTLDVEQYSQELGKFIDKLAELTQSVADNTTGIGAAKEDLTELTGEVGGIATRLGAAEGAINAETSERQTAVAALQTALEALKARVSQAEGDIATNAGDIATLQEDLQSVAQALNALSGSEDTTAVIDTFNEVVDFLAGITNDETLSAKLVEIKTLIKQNADDIDQLQQASNDTSAVQNSHGAAIGSLQTSMDTLSGMLSSTQNELGELSQMLVDYEDDAALALSNAEARLGRRIDAVGILPFNAIVEAHGSVSDGAPDYATQFPSTADGAYRHIIFDKSRGTFLWEIHAGDYPNCPAGDAYSAWTGSEEYVSEGHPRADRLYRLGNELYRWDGTALVSYSDAISAALDTKANRTELSNIVGTPSEGVIEDLEPTLVTETLRKTAQTLTPAEQAQVKKNIGVSKMELFIDMWNARATIRGRSYGGYDPENAPDPSTPFKLNDIWLSYADAIKVMNEPAGQPLKYSGFYTYGVSRTYFPILACSGSIESVGLYNHNLEVVRILSHDMVYNNADPDTALIPLNNTTGAFMHCFKLREVKGILKLSASDSQGKHFHDGLWMCVNLETIWLHSVSLNLSIASCQKIKVECLRYMVENAANTKAITITVHKDVFAKLTDETNTDWHQVLTDATNNNITFATV